MLPSMTDHKVERAMYGIYLECERCGKTIGGEDVTPKQQGIPTLTRWQGRELSALAADRGWAYQAPNADLCPECSKPPNVGAERQ